MVGHVQDSIIKDTAASVLAALTLGQILLEEGCSYITDSLMERPYRGTQASCQQPHEKAWKQILQPQLSLQMTPALITS